MSKKINDESSNSIINIKDLAYVGINAKLEEENKNLVKSVTIYVNRDTNM